MTVFKLKWSKNIYITLAVLLIALSFIGCVKADRESKKDQNQERKALAHGQIVATEFLDKSLTDLNNGARFRAGSLEMKVNTTFDGKGYWKQANQMELKFKVCGLQDFQTNGILDGQKFKIKSELGNPVEAISKVTHSGCLEWAYIVPINMVAASVNMALHFEIKSINNLGKITKRLGFNPWDIMRNETFRDRYGDLTNHGRKAWGSGLWVFGREKVLAALRGELLNNSAKLKVTNLSINPVEKTSSAARRYDEMLAELSPKERILRKKIDREMRVQQGAFINLNLSANPIVSLTDSTGVPYNMPIKTGRFRVFMNLLAHNTATGKKHIINQYVPAMSENGGAAFTWMADNTNGIQASLPMVLKAKSTYGEMELVVKIIPVDLKNVKPFTAVYNLGQYNQWARKQTPSFQKENHQPLSETEFIKYIENADNYKEYKEKFEKGLGAGADKSLAAQQLFYFDKFNIRFMRIMPGETATSRTFQYAVESCISHGVFGQRVGRGLQFEITTWDKGKPFTIIRQTRNNGCLTWFGFVSHQYYHKEVLEEKKAKVRFVGTVYSKKSDDRQKQWESLINRIEKNFTYYMNPWDEKFTFGWDGESLPVGYSEKIAEQKVNAPASKLFIKEFRYETMGFRYAIDKYMNLKVKKTVLLKVFPHVLKYNSIQYGRRGTEPLRDGIYLMKVALQKDYLDPAARGIVIRDKNKSDRVPQPIAEKNDQNVNEKLMDTDEVLRQDKKQQISVMTKLVRVLGGIIITPIEFEVKDLRLMTIRNQFFIQLQTIDENKLRLATFLDNKIKDLQSLSQANTKYEEIFRRMDQIEDLDQKVTDARAQSELNAEKVAELQKLTGDLSVARDGLFKMLGVSPGDEKKMALLKNRFNELDQYRRLGISGQTAARNDKWRTVSRLVKSFGENLEGLVNRKRIVGKEIEPEYAGAVEENPFQKYFFSTQETSEEAVDKILSRKKDGEELKDFLRNTDFTTGTLAPNFPFEMLTNNGLSEDKSGLPSRTFIGPLTFLLNSNGSPLRPTDILAEAVCPTATCSSPEKIALGIAPVPTIKSFGTDKSGRVIDLPGPVYELGDSVNAAYENNEYYGYLKKYYKWTVDMLIEKREKLLKKEEKLLKTSSQIINFVSALGLKYVNLGEESQSDLKDIDINCVKTANWKNVERCFKKTDFSEKRVLSKTRFLEYLNQRAYRFKRKKFSYQSHYPRAMYWQGNDNDRIVKKQVDLKDIKGLMKFGWKDSRLSREKVKLVSHRFCHMLSEEILSDEYRKVKESFWSQNDNLFKEKMEEKCHRQLENLYGGESNSISSGYSSPIIIERKVRVYNTTGKYVYRGGKSLNINTSANFSLSHSTGFGRNRSVSFKPGNLLKDAVGAVSKIFGSIVGSLGFSVSYSDKDDISSSDGTTVTSATFLVSQQATFDIELGEYERCMVVRFNPTFLSQALKANNRYLKDGFNPMRDLDTLGVMVCSGERKNNCLPIKEKYYYFTQHFTAGDMLDTADLHNHPWLLQLRGNRDFKAFVSLIGARKQKYVDGGTFEKYYGKISSDMSAMTQRETGNKGMELEVVNKDKESDWPLESLGNAFFNVLPTFPGLYTFIEDDEHRVKEWPYENPDPNEAFQCVHAKDE